MNTFEIIISIEVGVIAVCQLFGVGPWRRA